MNSPDYSHLNHVEIESELGNELYTVVLENRERLPGSRNLLEESAVAVVSHIDDPYEEGIYVDPEVGLDPVSKYLRTEIDPEREYPGFKVERFNEDWFGELVDRVWEKARGVHVRPP